MIHEVLIDTEDEEVCMDIAWCISKAGYVRSPSGVYLHRLLLGCRKGDGIKVDHRNHNKLDNRKTNLRAGSHSENMRNQLGHRDATHPVVGVSPTPTGWRSDRMIAGVRSSKTFRTEAEAIGHAEAIRRD